MMSEAPHEDQTVDPAPEAADGDDLVNEEGEVERGLGTGTPAVLREAARDVRRDEERLAAAAARKSTPEHWRD